MLITTATSPQQQLPCSLAGSHPVPWLPGGPWCGLMAGPENGALPQCSFL